MKKLIIIGLDGATYKLIDPLIQQKKLRNIAGIKEKGFYGTLESTIPPITAPAWLSMATGKNPGKTGVYDFLIKRSKEFSTISAISSYDFRANNPFWDILSKNGFRMGLFNFPMLYPPYDVNGYLVSGFGSPQNKRISYPLNLIDELDKVTGGYKVQVLWDSPRYTNKEELFLRDVLNIFNKRKKAFFYLLGNKNVDLNFSVFSVPDWAQHYFWKYIDPDSPFYGRGESSVKKKYLELIWKKIDDFLGEVIARYSDRANIIIVSDHGFGPARKVFYVNSWLEKEGYLERKPVKKYNNKVKDLLSLLKKLLENNLDTQSLPLMNIAKRISRKSSEVYDKIVFEKSKVFCPKHTKDIGLVYILAKKEEYNVVKKEIKHKLSHLSDYYDVSGVEIFDPLEIYTGDKISKLPDLLFTLDNFECGVSHEFSPVILENDTGSVNRSGSHTRDGIIMGVGPDIKKVKIGKVKILDIAPSILYYFNKPIPKDVDGAVLKRIFKDKFNKDRKIEFTDPPESEKSAELEERDDLDEVEKRLKNLGYL
jgi:predicted AlkP superfamily phosphohydrolase/phosphomutase